MKRLLSFGIYLSVLAGVLAGCAPGAAVTLSGADVTVPPQTAQSAPTTGGSGAAEVSAAQVTTRTASQDAADESTGAPVAAAFSKQDADTALDTVKPWFEEPENRLFEVDFPVTIEGLDYYKITVSGVAGGKTYPIDTFAIRPEERDRYFRDGETGEWVMFLYEPVYACATSPDGRLRAESVYMSDSGTSGMQALRDMRIIDTESLETLWASGGFLMNRFLWSPDSRCVCAQYSGRTWTETVIVDATNMKSIIPPGIEDIRAQRPDSPEQRDYRPDPYFEIGEWTGDTAVRIVFRWSGETAEVSGGYEYDLADKTLTVLSLDEENR